MVRSSYETAQRIFNGELSLQEGLTILQQMEMNEGSAKDYLSAYKCMRLGELYSRTINEYATEYYLQSYIT
jgi:hypothetical protein